MKVALFQMDIIWQNAKENIQKIKTAVETCNEQFDLLVLPEMFNTGFSMSPEEIAEPVDGYSLQALLKLSFDKKIGIIGSIPTEEDGKYYNRLYLIDDGLIIGHYNKNYLFSLANEDKAYSRGSSSEPLQFRGVTIQPQVCYDLRFPELLAGKKGIDVLINCANWPTKRTHHYHALLTGRAIENQCYAIGINRCGIDQHEWIYGGESKIVDYDGNTLLNIGEGEQFEIVDLDIEKCRIYKEKLPFIKDKNI